MNFLVSFFKSFVNIFYVFRKKLKNSQAEQYLKKKIK